MDAVRCGAVRTVDRFVVVDYLPYLTLPCLSNPMQSIPIQSKSSLARCFFRHGARVGDFGPLLLLRGEELGGGVKGFMFMFILFTDGGFPFSLSLSVAT